MEASPSIRVESGESQGRPRDSRSNPGPPEYEAADRDGQTLGCRCSAGGTSLQRQNARLGDAVALTALCFSFVQTPL